MCTACLWKFCFLLCEFLMWFGGAVVKILTKEKSRWCPMGVGTKRAYVFDRGFLGGMGRLLQCLRDAHIWRLLGTLWKMVTRPILYATIFKKAMDIISIIILVINGLPLRGCPILLNHSYDYSPSWTSPVRRITRIGYLVTSWEMAIWPPKLGTLYILFSELFLWPKSGLFPQGFAHNTIEQ